MARQDPATILIRERLKAAMAQRDPPMTQRELAARSGHTQQKVQRFLSGNTPYPALGLLDNLARVFGWSLVDLLQDHAPPVPAPPISDARVLRIAERLVVAGDEAIAVAEAWVALLTRRTSSGSPRGSAAGPRPTSGGARRKVGDPPTTKGKRSPRD